MREFIKSKGFVVGAVLGASVFMMSTVRAQTSDSFAIGDIEFYGASCSGQGQTSVVFNPDQTIASLLFSSFSAELGTGSLFPNARHKRVDCTARVPITLSKNFALTGFSADVRGFAEVNAGAAAAVLSQYVLWVPLHRYVSSYKLSKVTKSFRGPASEDFSVNETRSFDKNSAAYSCGKKVYLDVSMALDTLSNKAHAFAMLSMDSLDLAPVSKNTSSAFALSVRTARCR